MVSEFGNKNNVCVYVLYDSDKEDDFSHFIQSFPNIGFNFINCKSNLNSYLSCLELAEKLDSKYIYFLEDDYLHRPGAYNAAINGMNNFDLFTLFTHNHRWSRPQEDIDFGHTFNFRLGNDIWRSIESCCLTYFIKRDLFNKIKTHLKFFELNDREMFKALYRSNVRLFSPIYSYATHCVKNDMDVMVNWEEVSKLYV
jgi:hypothetical protein